jgi:hypothetical protein
MFIITVEENWKVNVNLNYLIKNIKLHNFHLPQILLKFEAFELKKPNECEKNFIDIFPEKTDLPSR